MLQGHVQLTLELCAEKQLLCALFMNKVMDLSPTLPLTVQNEPLGPCTISASVALVCDHNPGMYMDTWVIPG